MAKLALPKAYDFEPYITLRPNSHHLPSVDVGQYNGYVVLPKQHPCYGLDYDQVHERYRITVHGGITCSVGERDDRWVLGFDTCHHSDTKEKWPASEVAAEAERLLEQLTTLEPHS